MKFSKAVLYQKPSSKRPLCANRLSNCHTFTVRRFILLPFKHQTNKPTAISAQHNNDSTNTKLQNYKQQSLQLRSQSRYSYMYCEIQEWNMTRGVLWLYGNIKTRSLNRYCSPIATSTKHFDVCLHTLPHLSSKHNALATLYCRLSFSL